MEETPEVSTQPATAPTGEEGMVAPKVEKITKSPRMKQIKTGRAPTKPIRDYSRRSVHRHGGR